MWPQSQRGDPACEASSNHRQLWRCQPPQDPFLVCKQNYTCTATQLGCFIFHSRAGKQEACLSVAIEASFGRPPPHSLLAAHGRCGTMLHLSSSTFHALNMKQSFGSWTPGSPCVAPELLVFGNCSCVETFLVEAASMAMQASASQLAGWALCARA